MTDDRKLRDAKGISTPALVKAAIAFRHALRQHSGEPDADVHAMRAALLSLRVPDEAMQCVIARGIYDRRPTGEIWMQCIDQILATGERR